MKSHLGKIIILFALLMSSSALADRYDVLGGYYRITAKTSEKSPTIANVGVVKMSYHLSLTPAVTLRPGYSIYALKGSDEIEIGYGLDIGILWYFLSADPHFYLDEGPIKWEYNEIYRPYMAFSFHQRQYQAIQSSYAGIGLTVGCEFKPGGLLPGGMYFVSELNYMAMDGPLDSTLNEIQVIGGIGQQF